MMNYKSKLHLMMAVLFLTALACGTLDIGIEPSAPENALDQPNVEKPVDPVVDEQSPSADNNADPDQPDFSQYWSAVEDPRTGLKFAIPCYWTVDFPSSEEDPTAKFSVSVANFTEQFINSLGAKMNQTVFEIGGLKFDLAYHRKSDFGLGQSASIDQLAYALVNPDPDHGIDAITPVVVKGNHGVRVDTWSIFGKSAFFLLPINEDLHILFAPYPEGAADHADIQAILISMVLPDGGEVELPKQRPADPPKGMAVSCLPPQEEPSSAGSGHEVLGTLDCAMVTDQDELRWVLCNVQDSLISRNTQPLPGYMGDTFLMGYWQSEGTWRTPEEALAEIETSHLPPNTSNLTFTIEQNLFPPLFGTPAEQLVPPEANIVEVVYSEGWGPSGQGAALLYFAESQQEGVYFYGMVIAQQNFDK